MPNSPMSVSAIEKVLVGVEDMGAALSLFEGTMGLRRESLGPAPPALLAAFGVGGGARLAELSADGHAFGRLLLAEYDPPAAVRVRSHDGTGPQDSPLDIGPKAIDFYVADPIATAFEAVRGSGFPVRSEPITHEVGDTRSEEFVFWGPGGVPLLYMVGHRHRETQMRGVLNARGFSEIATVSIVGGDPARSRAFYGDLLGLELLQDDETASEFLDLANDLTGTPRGTPIRWQLYAGRGEPSGKILVVDFGGTSRRRLDGRMRPGHLGFSLLIHRATALDALAARLSAGGYPPDGPPVRVGAERMLLVNGPNADRFAFVEPA